MAHAAPLLRDPLNRASWHIIRDAFMLSSDERNPPFCQVSSPEMNALKEAVLGSVTGSRNPAENDAGDFRQIRVCNVISCSKIAFLTC